MPQTIIVSNRLPLSVRKVDGKLEYFPSSGGLATGMASFTEAKDNLWIGWPGLVDEELTAQDRTDITAHLKKNNCRPVFLSQKQVDEFYNGYANSILWPLLHNLPTSFASQDRFWRAYYDVNSLFGDAVVEAAEPTTTIWVHDYQLMLLPRRLRKLHVRSGALGSWQIGFFLHIPFPDASHFMNLAHHTNIIRGLLGSDLIGFHTAGYAQNFLNACHLADIGTVSEVEVILPDRVVQVTDFPLGIDYNRFSEASRSRLVKKAYDRLRDEYAGYKTILTVDRLDPTKGFIERLKAIRTFLKNNPAFLGKVKVIMLAVPTRADIASYKKLKNEVEQLVAGINKQFGTKEWLPIDYMYKTVPFDELSALYKLADVAFVAPLRDGMNLVAKEYVASKSGRNGVLILSETAGAAQELTDAVLVNPTRQASLVRGLTEAFDMPEKELKTRIKHMQEHLSLNTVQSWTDNFMNSLNRATINKRPLTGMLRISLQRRMITEYHAAKKRLILLDYDGTLAEFVDDPKDAKPSAALLALLRALATDAGTKLVVMTGRSCEDIEGWFGDLPVTVYAEYGATVKAPGKPWKQLVGENNWKKLLLPILKNFAVGTPGARVEEKPHSLVWHYRTANPYYAQKHRVQLLLALQSQMSRFGLDLYNGKKSLEIKPPEANKGAIVDRLLRSDYDFILAIGDDATDEDMYVGLPKTAYTVHVGLGLTSARYRLSSIATVHEALIRLGKE